MKICLSILVRAHFCLNIVAGKTHVGEILRDLVWFHHTYIVNYRLPNHVELREVEARFKYDMKGLEASFKEEAKGVESRLELETSGKINHVEDEANSKLFKMDVIPPTNAPWAADHQDDRELLQ